MRYTTERSFEAGRGGAKKDVTLPASTLGELMAALLVVKHDVGDFDTWLRATPRSPHCRRSLAFGTKSVHPLPDQPNTVLVLHTFDSVDAANAFVTAAGAR